MTTTTSLDHLYKNLFAKMVAGLVKSIGIKNIALAEDIVQETFIAAQEQWSKSLPDYPEAWLFKVCKNIALKNITKQTYHYPLEDAFSLSENPIPTDTGGAFKMILACAHPRFAPRQQVIFALRYAAGFKVDQISKILLARPETVTKTLQRIKQVIKTEKLELFDQIVITPDMQRIVLSILYLMFSEGYKTSSGKSILNTLLCEDALTFIQEIIRHPQLNTPDSSALYALMLFNLARFEARFTPNGDIIDLENQDRSKWNRDMIKVATHSLYSSKIRPLSKYHLEATITYLHCTAPSFIQTDWGKIVSLYKQLQQFDSSPFVKLNLAIARFYAGDVHAALSMMDELGSNTFIHNYHLYHIAMGKILMKNKDSKQAIKHYQKAILLTSHEPEKKYIQQLLEKADYSG